MANEVETEQIVYDASQTSLDEASFTSYVQLRGSIPLYWAHDLSRISKPPIICKQILHFIALVISQYNTTFTLTFMTEVVLS